MKLTQLLIAAALVGMGILVAGCDSETHPDPALVEAANAQRQQQGSGQAPPAPAPGP